MKNLSRILQPLGLLFFIGSVGIALLNLFAIIAASFGLEGPFNYFQYLRAPLWSVGAPVLGILSLLPLALHQAFRRETLEEKLEPEKPVDLRSATRRWRGKFQLRPI